MPGICSKSTKIVSYLRHMRELFADVNLLAIHTGICELQQKDIYASAAKNERRNMSSTNNKTKYDIVM